MGTYHPHERYVLNDFMHQVEEDEGGGEPKEQSGCMFLALRAVAKLRPNELDKKREKDARFGCEDGEFGRSRASVSRALSTGRFSSLSSLSGSGSPGGGFGDNFAPLP